MPPGRGSRRHRWSGRGPAFPGRFAKAGPSYLDEKMGKWPAFFRHLGSYVIIISMLAVINLLTSPDYWWFVWPALGWGVGLAFHLLGTFLGEDQEMDRAEDVTVTEREKVESRPAERPTSGETLFNKTIQAHLNKALAYKEQIDDLVEATSDQKARPHLQSLARQVNQWTQTIVDLARRVDSIQQNPLIRQDLESVPKSIEALKARLADETNQATRTELERTLTNRQNQLASLEQLQNTIERAEIKIESTLSALGTIYSQILTGQSTDHVADYSHLSSEMDEEVRTLQDHLEALEEVKLGRV